MRRLMLVSEEVLKTILPTLHHSLRWTLSGSYQSSRISKKDDSLLSSVYLALILTLHQDNNTSHFW